MKCPSCKKHDVQAWQGPLDVWGVQLVARGHVCPGCDEIVFTQAQVRDQEAYAVAQIVQRGIRSGLDFKAVRKAARLKAVEAAEMFDVSPETVSRWESGKLPIPRLAAFALTELYERPKIARRRLEALA